MSKPKPKMGLEYKRGNGTEGISWHDNVSSLVEEMEEEVAGARRHKYSLELTICGYRDGETVPLVRLRGKESTHLSNLFSAYYAEKLFDEPEKEVGVPGEKTELSKEDLASFMYRACSSLDDLKMELLPMALAWGHTKLASAVIQAVAKIDDAIRLCEKVHRDAQS